MKKDIFYKVDYKGKHFVIQDKLLEGDYSFEKITRKEILGKGFIKYHKANCEYYGIPPVITKDKDLLKVFR